MLNDKFRRMLLAQAHLIPSVLHYQSAIRTSLGQISTEIVSYLDVKLLSRLFNRPSMLHKNLVY